MEWLVKKSHYVKKRACHVLVLCDSGGSLKMIAEANSMILLSPGDILCRLYRMRSIVLIGKNTRP